MKKKKPVKLKVRHLLVEKDVNNACTVHAPAVVSMVVAAQRFPFYVNVHDRLKRPLTFFSYKELWQTLNAIAKHHALPARFDIAYGSVKYPYMCREVTLQDLME